MSNVASNSISVFPTVGRTQADALGRSQRLFTEQNVAKLSSMLQSKNFVLDSLVLVPIPDGTTSEKGNAVAFVLNGYYVEVLVSALPVGTVYASMHIQDGVLDGDNTSGEYTGISFDTTSGELLLGTKSESNEFTISDASKYMYDGSRVDVIDGGEI